MVQALSKRRCSVCCPLGKRPPAGLRRDTCGCDRGTAARCDDLPALRAAPRARLRSRNASHRVGGCRARHAPRSAYRPSAAAHIRTCPREVFPVQSFSCSVTHSTRRCGHPGFSEKQMGGTPWRRARSAFRPTRCGTRSTASARFGARILTQVQREDERKGSLAWSCHAGAAHAYPRATAVFRASSRIERCRQTLADTDSRRRSLFRYKTWGATRV